MPRWLEIAIGASRLVELQLRIVVLIAAGALLWRACRFYIGGNWI